jgi:phosphoglycolate phosphatase-like HAD superfamily hydrolase
VTYCLDKAQGQARAELQRALTWSVRVNELVVEIVKGMPPFPYAEDCLKQIATVADVIVCSSTPYEALVREWQEHGIAQYARVITGQEMGTKAEQLAYASKGHYKHDHMLMIGDAPGDRKASQAVDALFYPINPGHEIESWQRFHEEAWDRFIHLDYDGDYQAALIDEFESYLPEFPPWHV